MRKTRIKRDKEDFIQDLLTVKYDFKRVGSDIENESIEYNVNLNPVIRDGLTDELKAEFDEHIQKVLDIITVGFTAFATKTIKAEVERLQEEMGNKE